MLHRSAACNDAPPAASLHRQSHAAASVAAQRNPLQRSAACCIPAHSRPAAATQPTPSAAAAASAPLTAATGRKPQNPSERGDGRRSASSAGYSHLRHCSRAVLCCCSAARRAGLMHLLCVRCAAQLGTAHPYTPACAFWDCAHRSPPDWAHTRPHLHRDNDYPPPTSATGLSRSLAPPLPCERVHPLPTSAPQPNPSPADLCASPAALRDICLCATQV